MPGDWMSLSAVARLLGVHPGTVRNWSNQGVLPVHRTPGGHRRYHRSEIDLWMQSQNPSGHADANQIIQKALHSTRVQISDGCLNSETWYIKLDEEARQQYRQSGRELMQGLMGFLASDGKNAQEEAHALGYEYAARGRRHGLSVVEATHAFFFFRNLLMEAMFSVYEAALVSAPLAWSDMLRKITSYTDQIQLALLETYDAYERVIH
jgi:excisionase family DNA binding protein